MRIVLAVYGTRGDVQPNIALARGLMARGHYVTLCATPENGAWVKDWGCEFHPLGSDLSEYLDGVQSIEPMKFSLAAMRAGAANIRRQVALQFAQLPALFAGADLVLASSGAFGARTVAQSLGVPCRYMAFYPQGGPPSSRYPALQAANQGFYWWGNRISWGIKYLSDKAILGKLINDERKRLGLGSVNDVLAHILGPRVIVASDHELGPVGTDVTVPCHQVGHLGLPSRGELTPQIRAFIQNGAPPVFIGFGSYPVKDPAGQSRLFVEAALDAGRRVILFRGQARLSADVSESESCLVIDGAPFDRLFPLVAAVVHHGGAGTIATAARAGVPQVVLPQFFDHFYWAHRIFMNGLGPRPIMPGRITRARLAAAIGACTEDRAYRDDAAAMGVTLRGVDCLGRALDLIESPSFIEE